VICSFILRVPVPKHHSLKTYWGSGYKASFIRNIDTRWGGGHLHRRLLYPRGNVPR